MRRLACALALALSACAHGSTAPRSAADVALVETPGWRTLTAQHRVVVDAELGGGRHESRTLRGLVAVARPDRLRLRALGPAGITLFDLLLRDGKPTIVSAIRTSGAAGDALAGVVASLAGDLACAYALSPAPPDRHVRLDGDAVLVEEPGRRVRLSHFAGTPAVWRHAEIVSSAYRVTVDVDDVTIDPTLEPALFSP